MALERRSRARFKVGGPVPAPGGTEHATSPTARPSPRAPTSPRGRRQLCAREVLLVVLVFVLRRRLSGQILRLRRLPGVAALGPGLPPATRHLPLQFLLRLRRRRQGSVHGRAGGSAGPAGACAGHGGGRGDPRRCCQRPAGQGARGSRSGRRRRRGQGGREGGKEGREGRRAGASREPGLAGRRSASGSGKPGSHGTPARPGPAHSQAPPCPLHSHAPSKTQFSPSQLCAPPTKEATPSSGSSLAPERRRRVRGGAWPDGLGADPPLRGCFRKEPDLFVCLLIAFPSLHSLLVGPEIEVKCQSQVS